MGVKLAAASAILLAYFHIVKSYRDTLLIKSRDWFKREGDCVQQQRCQR